jgi:phenylalanyl-tRNA synthetase beta chain
VKVPVSWLREYVTFELPIEEVARRLLFTSCEVDRVVRRGVVDLDGNLDLFRVGHVLEAVKHPNADRLQLCSVDVGEELPREIVCGAWNFGAGATVAVALPGAILPGREEPLSEAKLRGVLSRGMILSERELELGIDHSGILVLEDGPAPGTPLADVLPLADTVLEMETGFNRPDLTCIYGIAREVATLTGAELAPAPGEEAQPPTEEAVDVRVEDLRGCPRYVGRLLRGARVADSPLWLKARLLAAGMRPISNVVDVTNYVMLALGNPLHAFDHDQLAEGRIVVRRARRGEALRTLDGTVRALDPADLMIADAERSVAIAGVMGGEASEVRPETTAVLLEAANFDPLTVLRTSRRLRLRTESSTRWEKGIDPYGAGKAAAYATQLLVELSGARCTGATDVHGDLPQRPVAKLRPELTDALTGMKFAVAEQRQTLERLGFDVSDDLTVTVPTWRGFAWRRCRRRCPRGRRCSAS